MNVIYASLLLVYTVLIFGVLNRLLGEMLDDAEYDIILGVEQRLRHSFLDLPSQSSITRKLNSFDIFEA